MKRLLALLLIMLFVLPFGAFSEGDTVTFQKKVTVQSSAEYVDLGDVKAKSIDDLIKFLHKLPNLQKADMFATPVYAKDINKLVRAFPEVEFGWTMCISCNNPAHRERNVHKIRTDATAFSTFHNNQCSRHSSADFEILKYCKNMMALDIGHNAVTSLDFLRYMPKLRVLIIGRNYVKDLSPLASCPDLEYLEAFTNEIESVEPLLSCTHLMDVNIPNNKVKDPELFAEMTSLKRLWAFNCSYGNDMSKDRMPGSVKNAIRKALPSCKINWTASGTGGDWRGQSAHYKVIQKMFNDKQVNAWSYVPFADSYQ